MLNWHKNKYFTGKQKYFLSRHEVHLYFTELLRRMRSYSLIFMLNQTQEGWIYSQKKWELDRKWCHSLRSLSPSSCGIKRTKKERDRKRARAFIRWVKGWLDVSHRHKRNKQWRMRGFRTEPQITVIIFPLTVNTVSSVPGVQHQWVRGHTCFHRVSPVLLSASQDRPQSESRLPEEQSDFWGSTVGQNRELWIFIWIFISTLTKNFFRTSFSEAPLRPSSSPWPSCPSGLKSEPSRQPDDWLLNLGELLLTGWF